MKKSGISIPVKSKIILANESITSKIIRNAMNIFRQHGILEYLSLAITPESYNIGNNLSINSVIFGFTNIHTTKGVRLNGILSHGIHRKNYLRVKFTHLIHQFIVTRMRIVKFQLLEDNFTRFFEDSGFMMMFSYITSYNYHESKFLLVRQDINDKCRNCLKKESHHSKGGI